MGHKVDSYARPWLVTLSLIIGIWGTVSLFTRVRPALSFPQPAVASEGVDWFFILRMPAIKSQHESGIDTMKVRIGEWLDILTKAGYRPTTFSDVQRALEIGSKLPPKSVVLVFDPGFKRAYRVLEPVFERHRWPAVWLSDEAAMQARHREYVTYRTAERMVKSGLWDVGLKKKNGSYSFSIGREKEFVVGGNGKKAWVPWNGSSALNRLKGLHEMNRLFIHADWLNTDLLSRLNAEIPIEKKVFLAVGNVQNQIWGVSQPSPHTFNLGVRPWRKDLLVSWNGSLGQNNSVINAYADMLSGTFALRFRWDDVQGSGIQVAVMRDKVIVQEWHNSVPNLLFHAKRVDKGQAFKIKTVLAGNHLALTIDDVAYNPFLVSTEPSNQSVIQLYLYDRVRGVSKLEGLQIAYEPLPQTIVSFSTPNL